jgi:hypothetical protein
MPRSMRPRTLVTALAVAVLAVPAPAFAQSAGDSQYTDPLAGENGGGSSGGGSSGGGGGSQPQASPSAAGGGGTGTGAAQGSGAAGSSAAGTQSGGGGIELADTGFPAGLLAALGMALLVAGALIRRFPARRHPVSAFEPSAVRAVGRLR